MRSDGEGGKSEHKNGQTATYGGHKFFSAADFDQLDAEDLAQLRKRHWQVEKREFGDVQKPDGL